MKNTKRSLTLKIIVSYVLAAILTTIAFWVIYAQVNSFTEQTDIQDDTSQKLFLVSDILTNLYEAESLTLHIIKTGDTEKVDLYKTKIDTILSIINNIGARSNDAVQIQKIDSLKLLIASKNNNLDQLVAIYKKRKQKGLYATAISELKKANKSFEDRNYKRRFKNLDPNFRKRLINILNLSREDNAQRLTNQTVDSLTTSVRQVLAELERKDKRNKRQISAQENKLLKNDQIITKQLRDFLTAVEQNEIKASFERVTSSQEILSRTSQIIAVVAVLSIILVLVFLFLITKDISRSQQYRLELETAKTYAESLLESKESFMNMITHDLRSPLNTVLGYLELLHKTELDKKQEHYLNNLKKSSDYTLHLVNDLLDFSKLEAGKMQLEKLPFYPDKLIDDAVTVAIPITDKKDLTIKVHTSDTIKQPVLGDPFRIKQILMNLMANAYKFTPNGHITITARYNETLRGTDTKTMIISIQDTGIGMTEAQQEIVFKEFSQADVSTQKNYGGSGLGLAITQKIITLLGGRISLESTPEKGSVFTIFIPVTPILEEEIPINITEAPYAKEAFDNKQVLIIDDEPAQLALAKEVISNAGVTVDCVTNVPEALEKLEKKHYDLIFTDIQMPQINGFEFLEMLKKTQILSKTPVIALSGRTDIDTEDYIKKGFTSSLRKPYAPNMLVALMAKTLQISDTSETKVSESTSMPELPKNPNYSLDELLVFAQNDPDSLHSILEVLQSSTTQNLRELQNHLEKKNLKKIPDLAHKMLPMFRQIKAIKVIPALEKLERASIDRLYKKTIISLSKEVLTNTRDLMHLLQKDVLDRIR